MPIPMYELLMKLPELATQQPTIEAFVETFCKQNNMAHLSPLWNTWLAEAWAEGEQIKPMEDRMKEARAKRFVGDASEFGFSKRA